MKYIGKNCENYLNFIRIGSGTYSNVYRALDKKNQIYDAIKEIDKLRFNQPKEVLKNEVEIMKKIQNENSVELREIIETNDFFYIITEYCEYDLETYINQKRQKSFSVNEIRETLIQINNTLKLMLKEELNHRDLKPKNILISLSTLNKNIIKLLIMVQQKQFLKQ
jgi:serine/threonine protein kinase